ncbi:Hypothetical_protein [Hexamita inflata]|uniref:Hypothetical_protein n=1 Tax=Hexamita inflata TaxID=28002 RepID=A0AA86QHR2_9EUKA|nr:Hypothetical protein HINF_LOCUS41019 [Hexamita inflata]
MFNLSQTSKTQYNLPKKNYQIMMAVNIKQETAKSQFYQKRTPSKFRCVLTFVYTGSVSCSKPLRASQIINSYYITSLRRVVAFSLYIQGGNYMFNLLVSE